MDGKRVCDICGRDDRGMHYIVTLRCQLACWACVDEAVSYYRDAIKEQDDDK